MQLNRYDKHILAELESNSRISLAQLAKKSKISKSNVKYRLDKLKERKIIKKEISFFNLTKLGFNVHHLYFKLNIAYKEKYEEIKEALTSKRGFVHLHFCEGYYDLRVILISQSNKEFKKLHSFCIEYLGAQIIVEKIHQCSKIEYFCIFNEKHSSFTLYDLEKEKEVLELKEQEKTILRELSEYARINTIELAKKTEQSPRTALYNLRKLEKEGIIVANSILINDEKLNLTHYHIDICVKKEQSIPEILSFFRKLGVLHTAYTYIDYHNLTLEILCDERILIQEILTEFRNLYGTSFYQCDICFVRDHTFAGWYN